MKRLKSLCNFLIGIFTSMAALFATMAAIWHKPILVILGLISFNICMIIIYNVSEAEKEAEEDQKKEK